MWNLNNTKIPSGGNIKNILWEGKEKEYLLDPEREPMAEAKYWKGRYWENQAAPNGEPILTGQSNRGIVIGE